MTEFPSDEAVQAANRNSAGIDWETSLDTMKRNLRKAYAVDEPAIRADQTRRIVEALRRYNRNDLSGVHVVHPADFVAREFGEADDV